MTEFSHSWDYFHEDGLVRRALEIKKLNVKK